jgi:FdhE protein
VRRGPRGGPGDFGVRLARAERLATETQGVARDPLTVLVAVLRHQQRRADSAPAARRQPDDDRFPLLDLDATGPAVTDELVPAIEAVGRDVPEPLAEAGVQLRRLQPSELAAVVETWLDDPSLVQPRLGFWLQVAAGPVLEGGARGLSFPAGWSGSACPGCGGPAQASVIAEESGEFMAGSPRSLVCGRCASWWSFPRATCVGCGEDDSRQIASFLVDDQRWVRVDTCATCRGYIKTFDLRQTGGVAAVPLVDDVATLTLDVWAQQRGYARAVLSLAGV